jgi:hypothetical protein
MNVSDLDGYMDVLYIMFANCPDFIISVVLVILFFIFLTQANLRRLG